METPGRTYHAVKVDVPPVDIQNKKNPTNNLKHTTFF